VLYYIICYIVTVYIAFDKVLLKNFTTTTLTLASSFQPSAVANPAGDVYRYAVVVCVS